MFKRVLYEHWHEWLPLIAFGSTAFIYCLMSLRGITLRKDKAEHMSHLPLDD